MSNIILDKNQISDPRLDKELNRPRTLKLTEHPSEVCPKCGSKLFTHAVVIKDVPGVLFGEIGIEKVPYPVEQFPVMVCAKCGELAPAMFLDKDGSEALKKLLGEEEGENGNEQ